MNKRTEKIEIIKNFDTNISKKITKTVLFVQYLGMNTIACRCVNKLVAYQYITVHITQAMQS